MTAPFQDWADDSRPLARLRLQVRAEPMRAVVTLEGYADSGTRCLTAYLIAMPTPVWRPPTILVRKATARPGDAPVALSPPALALATQGVLPLDASRSAAAWFTPEANEPLDLMAGEALGTLEPQAGRKCVAVQAADLLWGDVRLAVFDSRLSPAAFRAMMAERSHYERIESENGVVWRVRNMAGRELNADRKAMGSLARSVLKAGAVTPRGLSVYHRQFGPMITDVSAFWERTVRGSPAIRTFSGDASHTLYSLIGAIPEGQWRSLGAGVPITVERLGIGREFATVLDEDRVPVTAPTPFPDVLKHSRESFDGDAPGLSVVSLTLIRTPLIGVALKEGGSSVQWTDGVPVPSALELSVESGVAPVPALTRELYERWLRRFFVQVGHQDKAVFRIRFPNGLSQTVEFTEPVAPASALAEFGALPREVQDSIWERAKQANVR